MTLQSTLRGHLLRQARLREAPLADAKVQSQLPQRARPARSSERVAAAWKALKGRDSALQTFDLFTYFSPDPILFSGPRNKCDIFGADENGMHVFNSCMSGIARGCYIRKVSPIANPVPLFRIPVLPPLQPSPLFQSVPPHSTGDHGDVRADGRLDAAAVTTIQSVFRGHLVRCGGLATQRYAAAAQGDVAW